VRDFCDRYRWRVLVSRTFFALSEHGRTKAGASEQAEEALREWGDTYLLDKLERAIEAWRHLSARNSLLRRSQEALSRFVRSSRLRLWVREWRDVVWKRRKLASKLTTLQDIFALDLLAKTCRSWRRATYLLMLLHRHETLKLRQKATSAWRAWCRYTARERSSRRATDLVVEHRKQKNLAMLGSFRASASPLHPLASQPFVPALAPYCHVVACYGPLFGKGLDAIVGADLCSLAPLDEGDTAGAIRKDGATNFAIPITP